MKKFLLLLTIFIAFGSIRAEKLYWVGGSGNFNDAAHWSWQSGGAGGAKVPTLFDDVVFNNKSSNSNNFQVFIQGAAFCKNFTVEENTFPLSVEGNTTGRIKIQGDFKLNNTVKWNLRGKLEFTGDGLVAIDFGRNQMSGDLIFNSASGQFIVDGAIYLKPTGTLFLENGHLNVSNNSITAGFLAKNASSIFDLTVQNTAIQISGEILVNNNLRVHAQSSQLEYNINDPANSNFDSLIFNGLDLIDYSAARPITAVVVVDSVSCPNACDGSMLVTFNGTGSAPYTMTFTSGSITTFNPVLSSPFLATGLCGGNYTIRVYNSVGTQIGSSANNIMYEPSPMAVNYNAFAFPECNGDCTGEIQFDVIGGNPTYSLTWNPGNTVFTGLAQGQADSLENLCAGAYTVNIVDRKGCTATDAFTILQPTVITPNSGVNNQLCFGVCDGSVFVSPSGGTPFGTAQPSGILYAVQWDGNVTLTNDTLYNLCPGTHTYIITDGNNCTISGSVTINPKTPITFTKSVPTPISCADVCNGTANITGVSGGTAPYSFSWTGPTVPTVVSTATTSTATAMCPGTYTCTITDGNGCDTTTTFVITSPALLVGGISTTNVSCFNGTNGTATGSNSGGTGPTFIYNWFSASNPTGGPPFSTSNPTVNNLTAGNYTLVVVDANGCNDTVTFTITQPTQLLTPLTPTNPNCFGATNGQVCANPSGGTGGISLSWLPIGGTVVGNCYTNLGAGTYTVTATDANGCTATVTTTLTVPPQIFPNLTHTNPTCNAACNGTATSVPTGGSGAGYTFAWTCSAATTSSINSQCAGSCTLTVTDGSGCTQTASTTFVDPNPLTVTLNSTTLSCAGASTAQIASTVNGGTAPYTYSWSMGPTTPGLSNVGAGTYTLTVTDFQSCVQTASVTIASPTPIVINTTPTNPVCSGGCNGSIATMLSGGTPPYTVLWLPTNSTNLNQINLCSGTYTITVRDANNCLQSQTVVLVAPLPVTVTTDSTLTSCIGICNGTATATASGGNAGGYTYSWNNGQLTQTATGLCDGTYTVTATDPLGCVGSATATVTEPPAVTVFISAITPSCANICTGSATIIPGGGTPGYTFTLDAVSIGATTALTNLCSGTHTVVVTDANGCTATTTFIVPTQVSLTVTASSSILTCNGDCNATATANVAGGINPITYLWSSPAPTAQPTQSTQTATALCAGTHTIIITDGIGCQVTSTVTFVNPAALVAPVVTTPVDCNGNCTGTANVTPAGGTGLYTVTWSNGTIGVLTTGLCVGTYTATIVDANGCTITQTATITEPTALTVTNVNVPPATCGGTNGSITIAPAGGSGSYTFNWMPGNINTNPITNIGAGVYTVTITDAITGCDTIIPYALSDPSGPLTTQSSTNVSCPGACIGSATVDVTTGTAPITVTWPGGTPTGPPPITASNLCAGVYPVMVTDATACISFETVIITQPANFVDNEVLTNVLCNGGTTGSIVLSPIGGTRPYTYTIDAAADDSSMTGLAAGTHTVVITDANGCTYTFNYILTQPTILTASETHANISCTTGFGSATASGSGGTFPYTFSWSNGANTATAANLAAGTYTCTVTDANGCSTQVTATIGSNPVLVSGFTATNNLCSAGCSGVGIFAASGGSGVYSYSWSTGQTTASVNGICPGSYTATVLDNNGCSVIENFTITSPTPVSVSAIATNPSCNGSGNGSILSTPSGGTPPYTFSWSPNVSSSQNAINLTAGSYTLTVTDANGCSTSLVTVLGQPAVLLASVTPIQPTCFGDCNGLLVSAPVGGTAPFSYAWGPVPTGTNDSLTGLCIGTYSVVVTDANTCRDTATVTLSQPPQVGLTASSSAANCGTIPCNGSVTINSIVGNTLNWLNSIPPGFSGLSQTNLCAGIYNIEVSDLNGCRDTVSVGVSNSNGPLVNVDSTDVSCLGSCNGSATVVSVSGNAPFTYSWAAPITDTDSIASSLCAGTYISQVTDLNGCITVSPIDVNEPFPMDDHEVVINASCNGVNNGSIVLAPTGGTAPFSYAWSNGAPDSPSNLNLAPGSYSVTISDANLCTYPFVYNVGSNSQILYQLAVTNVSCFGQCNGTAVFNNVNGGTAPYTFVWSDGQSGTTANALCAGNYTATITDNVGCFRTVDTVITQPIQLTANPTVTNTACGVCAGTISLVPTGGTSSYNYLWSNGQTTSAATSLCAGIYMVDVTDAVGCVSQFSIAVNNTSGPTVNTAITDVACGGQCTGAAIVTATGGTIPYQYNWISGGQTTPSLSNMCAGTYFVQVKDAANCLINDTVIISETAILVATNTTTPTTCGACNGTITMAPTGGTLPYTYTWSNGLPASGSQSNLCAGNYSVVVTDGAGCTLNSFLTINSNNAPVINVVTDSVSCNLDSDGQATVSIAGGTAPYNVSWSTGSLANPTLTGLSAGMYAVSVTDASGCGTSKTFTIEEPTPLALSFNNTQLPSCAVACNGALTAIPSGGSLSYSYVWTPGNATTDDITGLCAGTYSVAVTDSKGCTISQVTQLNNNPTPFSVVPTNANATCGQCDGSSSLAVSGGVPAYSFNWSNGNTSSSSTNLCAGVYMVDIMDAIGCVQQYSVAISNTNGPVVDVDSTDVTCAGQCTGTATVTVSGGVSPYQYNWLSGGQTTASVSGLCAGTYFVQVRDANNCTTTQPVVINEQTVLTANAITTVATCGVCDGTATLNPSGGSGSYTYVWSNGLPPTASQTGLCAGFYSVEITDVVNGCKDTVLIAVISSINSPLVTLDVDSVSCNGSNNGQATVSISGGTSPYVVTWSTGSVVNPTLSGLSAGNYAVSVEDALGCVSAQVFTVEEPDPLALSLNNTQLPSCSAACNGALTAIPSGGSLNYSYLWAPANQTTDTLSGLCAGIYSVTVTDSKGCTVSQVTQLNNNPTTFTVTPTNIDAACGVCDGSSSLSVSGGLAPYIFGWGNGDASSFSDSLCAGVYPVNITDALGCAQQYSVAINNTNAPTLAIATTNIACAGQCTGAATVTPSGGATPYQYNWLSGGQTTATVSNVCVGTYFVQVKDANNCVATQQVDITAQTLLIANAIVAPATCGACDGTATLSPSGGSGSYTYAWSNGLPSTPTQTGLCAGSYSVEITDAVNGCKDTVFIAVSSSNAPLVLLDVDSANCNGNSDGQATLAISGGTPGYTIAWSNGSAANPLTGLAAGNYAVSVTDAAGCVSAQVFTVDEPNQLALSLNNTQLPNCSAVCNGALTAIPSGGLMPYSYLWSPGAFTTDTLTNLCAGTYSLIVTDLKGCTVTQTSVLNNNPTPFNVTNTVTSPGCNLCDGLIDITLSGGITPFTYVWSNGSLTEDVDSVCAGLYQVDITDNVGCSQTVSFPISNAGGITGETIVVTNETCFGSCDGTASVTPVGGTPGYTYQWLFNGATTNSQSNLCSTASPYYVQISDTVGCIWTSEIDILSPAQMSAIPSIVSPTCGNSDGSISLNVSGGTGVLTYVWTPAVSTTNSATGLSAGVYSIAVTDASPTPCTQTFTVNLSNVSGPAVVVFDTSVSCNGLCDGSITLTITSANPTTVAWNTGSNANPLTNLCPGNYSATITDNVLGCVTVISATITEPDTINFSLVNAIDPLCNGICTGAITSIPSGGVLPYTFVWSPVAGSTGSLINLCANTYTVTVTDANGCVSTQSTTLVEPTDIITTGVITNASCSSIATGAIDITAIGGTPNTVAPSYTYQWSGGSTSTTEDLSSILFGSYTVVVTDANSCTDTTMYNVAATDTVISNAGPDLTFCITGDVILDGSSSVVNNGIITYEWSVLPLPAILGTNDSLTVTPSAGALSYQLIVTNSLGCSDTDTVVTIANPLPLANAGPDVEIVYGQFSLIGGSPTAPVGTTLSWLPNVALSNNTIPNPVSTNTLTTTYVVTVIDTATGCISRDSMLFTVLPQIIIPNGISPNGDGKNDFWIIDAIYKFPENEVEVYNRWGELLYYKRAYDNTWDGSYNGKPLPIGTYYYVVKLNDPAYPDTYTGPITIFK